MTTTEPGARNVVLSSHEYTLDEMNRRTQALRQDGSRWGYGYNLRGEVTSAVKEDATELPFVEGVFKVQREEFSPKRKNGARRLSECAEPLYTLRQLRRRTVE